MKYYVEYNIKSNITKYNYHLLQLSKIFEEEKTKAHHDVINKRRTRINVCQSSKIHAHRAKIVHRPLCLKEYSNRESNPRLATQQSFHHPDDH